MSNKKIREIVKKPHVIHKDSTMKDAADMMGKFQIGVLPVFDKDQSQWIGVLTDRDIVIRGVANERPPMTRIHELMTPQIFWCDANDDISTATKIMKDKKIRRLLVKDNGKFFGILSLGDLCCSCRGTEMEKTIVDTLFSISSGPTSQ